MDEFLVQASHVYAMAFIQPLNKTESFVETWMDECGTEQSMSERGLNGPGFSWEVGWVTFLFQACVSGLQSVKLKCNSTCPAFPPGLEKGSHDLVGVF